MAGGRVALAGSTVLLTGATGGIGHAIARELNHHGAQLILTGRRDGVLDGLAAELGARALSCDLASRDAVARLAGQVSGAEILVANAALPASGCLEELSQEEIDGMLEVNLRAPIALARALVPAMIERGAGHMVFVSSLQGKTGTPASALYCATKFGLRGFALGIREDLREHGIGVSTIFPGFIRDAGMFADTGVKLPPGVGTRSPVQVAQGIVRAIEHDRAELDVAPLPQRLGTAVAGLVPELAASVSRRLGSHKIARGMVERQRAQR
ncbi:MAG: SDR family NAD(P)-dependent oxidoreductase [Solirubrobacteraceae bacterium]